MLRCMYSGISGMKNNQNKLDVIGNNIANVGTTGFKSSRAQFSDMLYQNSATATSPTANKGGTNAAQVGLGAKLSSIDRVMSQGNLLATGRSLDTAVDGEGYFIVGSGPVNYKDGGTTVNGTNFSLSGGDMSINYTRDGNFKLDNEGNLVTADGYRVMGYLLTSVVGTGQTAGAVASAASSIDDTGKAHYVNPDLTMQHAGGGTDAKLQPLKIPDSVDYNGTQQKIASFNIGKDGIITAVLANGSRTALGQIATATFKNPEGLTAIGGNLYEVSPNSGTEIVRCAVNTANGNDKAFGDVVQGCLEASNVELTEQFTDMITATRSFQASSKMITTADEILQTVTGLMR